jgi:hypothetical protein
MDAAKVGVGELKEFFGTGRGLFVISACLVTFGEGTDVSDLETVAAVIASEINIIIGNTFWIVRGFSQLERTSRI